MFKKPCLPPQTTNEVILQRKPKKLRIALFLITKSHILLWEEGPSLLKITLKLANLERFQMSLSLGAQLSCQHNQLLKFVEFLANKDD